MSHLEAFALAIVRLDLHTALVESMLAYSFSGLMGGQIRTLATNGADQVNATSVGDGFTHKTFQIELRTCMQTLFFDASATSNTCMHTRASRPTASAWQTNLIAFLVGSRTFGHPSLV